jgi:neutral ceramidase
MTGLSAGVAGSEITPDRLLHLEGYSSRTHAATGTRDPLEARALALDDGSTRVAILCADLCGLEAPSVARIRGRAAAASGVPSDQILVIYSHTHSAPAMTPFGGVPVDADYAQWVEAELAALAGAAASRLQPVALGVGEGQADFNVNRRLRTPSGTVMRANPQGAMDRRVRVMRLDPLDAPEAPGTLGGQRLPQSDPAALLFSYACHPTVLGGSSYRYSGDYPAAARRFVEQAYAGGAVGGTRALFLPGCFGNLRPHLLRPDGSFREGTDHELTVLGRRLGSEVVRVAEAITTGPAAGLAVGRREVWLPYAPVPGVAELKAALDGPQGWWARAMLDRLEREGRLPDGEMSEVQVLRVGRHWLVALPGEPMLEIGLSIERGLAELGLACPERGDLTLALGYSNGYPGYLPSASAFGEGGYEPATAYPDYLRPAPFAPEVEAALVDAALGPALELTERSRGEMQR